MDQNNKPFEKGPLSHFFPISESPSFQNKQIKRKSGLKQNKTKNLSNKLISEKTPGNKISAEKAVYVTHTQEVSFEEFLKSKPKKP